MNYIDTYNKWVNNPYLQQDLRKELLNMNEEEIKERFYKTLKFGTAGLRGELGVGTNRMNIYTVALATKGLADTINSSKQTGEEKSVVIAYDVRYMSREFAEIAAAILAYNKIKVYMYDNICPTPLLSYSVRELNASAGIMITASHNPKEYNGYKVYNKNGSQILDRDADEILNNINKVENVFDIETIDFKQGLERGIIEYINDDVINSYKKEIFNLSLNNNIDKELSIVFSPLNGTGAIIEDMLKARGFSNVYVVEEQKHPDPEFTTVSTPNPENPDVFELSEKLGKQKNASILLATDPDADRVSVKVKNSNNEYIFLSGNQMGALLTNYILSQLNEQGLPKNPVIVKSIVTDDLSEAIANKFGVETIDVLVGFKYIYGLVNEWDLTKEKSYIFGYEESAGFGLGTFTRDKDAVSASLMIAEMAAFYSKQGKSLLDVLEELYQEFGHREEKQISKTFEGAEGQKRVQEIMANFRTTPIEEINGSELILVKDYMYDNTGLERSNTLEFRYDDFWFAIRPSGTEPKLKKYIYVKSDDKSNLQQLIKYVEDAIDNKIKGDDY